MYEINIIKGQNHFPPTKLEEILNVCKMKEFLIEMMMKKKYSQQFNSSNSDEKRSF